jgi:hypothetical protein
MTMKDYLVSFDGQEYGYEFDVPAYGAEVGSPLWVETNTLVALMIPDSIGEMVREIIDA